MILIVDFRHVKIHYMITIFRYKIEIEENTKSTQCILHMQSKETQTPKTFFKGKAVLKKEVMQSKGT